MDHEEEDRKQAGLMGLEALQLWIAQKNNNKARTHMFIWDSIQSLCQLYYYTRSREYSCFISVNVSVHSNSQKVPKSNLTTLRNEWSNCYVKKSSLQVGTWKKKHVYLVFENWVRRMEQRSDCFTMFTKNIKINDWNMTTTIIASSNKTHQNFS